MASVKQLFFLTTMDEEEINGVFDRFPKLGERVRDWMVIARQNDYIVVHIIIRFNQAVVDRLKALPEYLGHSYKKIAQKAKDGDAICLNVLKKIIFTTWEIDNPDPEGPAKINYRGSLDEWIDAGRPERLSGWYCAHVWLGQAVEIPSHNEIE